jgi:putative nucleotidyltransferase with HDIG domain
MTTPRRLLGRFRLRHLLFILLLLSGIAPLAFSSMLLIGQNREILESQERSYLTSSAQTLSEELSSYLAEVRGQLRLLAEGVLAPPPAEEVEARLRQPWVGRHLERFLLDNPQLAALRMLGPGGAGPSVAPSGLPAGVRAAMDWTFEQVLASEGRSAYRFIVLPDGEIPLAVLAVPVADAAGRLLLVAEAALHLEPMETLFDQEAQGDVEIFLVDRDGEMLWTGRAAAATVAAVQASPLVRDFVAQPLNMTQEYSIRVGKQDVLMLGRVSPVPETGWGLVVHRPAAVAYAAVQEMVVQTALSTAFLILLSLLVAGIAARRLSFPIQRLAETANEVAAGNFGKRIAVEAAGSELEELAQSFNAMTDEVQSAIGRLEEAARQNRELFIGSLQAFAAAIDAKDPYTRGHSERVARYSREIARAMGLSEELVERTWVAALVHDIGKIGVDDTLLKKGTTLSANEFEQMKLHPIIGARILDSIEQLRHVVPAVRGHHEAWDGSGYPDGLAGEGIPLLARIVAAGDTLDAVTTTRPYHEACSLEYALDRITELVGRRFDPKVVSALLEAVRLGHVAVDSEGSARSSLEDFVAAVLT